MIVTKTTLPVPSSDNASELPVFMLSVQKSIRGSAITTHGTLGCFLLLRDCLYGMTNYHVLFGEHSPEYVKQHFVDTLEVFSQSEQGSELIGHATQLFNPVLDYALFKTSISIQSDALFSLGKPIEPCIGMSLHKAGATTGLTHGIIDESSLLEKSLVYLRKNKSKPVETLCDYGDSGSLWLYDDGGYRLRPVALHAGTAAHEHRMGRAHSFTSILDDIHLQLNT